MVAGIIPEYMGPYVQNETFKEWEQYIEDESISQYREMNPDRYPDVVIASCCFGELDPVLARNGWMKNWLEEDFKPQYYIDGKYWRYYLSSFNKDFIFKWIRR